MTLVEAIAYIDYVWRLVNPNARLAQPDDDGYRRIGVDESVGPLMDAVEAVMKVEYDEEHVAVLNRIFGTKFTPEQWEPFQNPKSVRTIGDLAAVVAQHAEVPVVEPLQIAGLTSWEGGLFRNIVAILETKGVDPKRISPSTKLSGFLLKYADAFQWIIARLAPAQMPPVHHRYTPWVEYCQIVCTILMLGLIAMCGPGFLYFTLTKTTIPLGVWFWLAALVVVGAITWLLPKVFKPKRAAAGQLQTFHDLCSALAVPYRER